MDKWVGLETSHHPQLIELERQVFWYCHDLAKTPAVGRTLIMHGLNGTGKTHCAEAIHKWVCRCAMKLPLVPIGHECSLIRTIYANWPDVVDGFKEGAWGIVDDLIESTVTIIDDIGAEHDPSRIGVEKLYRILTPRELKWNVFTTNSPPEEWEEKFERRIASRFFRNADHVDLSNVPDFGTL